MLFDKAWKQMLWIRFTLCTLVYSCNWRNRWTIHSWACTASEIAECYRIMPLLVPRESEMGKRTEMKNRDGERVKGREGRRERERARKR